MISYHKNCMSPRRTCRGGMSKKHCLDGFWVRW